MIEPSTLSARDTPATDAAAIATRLLDGRLWVSDPVVAGDGERVAFTVSSVDLDKNRTTSKIWLVDGDDPPRPITSGTNDGSPEWSPDGRFITFVGQRGDDDAKHTLNVLPADGPGEVRTLASFAEPPATPRWSPDGRTVAFTVRSRDERYDADDESWQAPRKIERFFSRLDNVGWILDRPRHVYVVAADGTSAPRNLTPGPFQHDGVSWLPDSSAVVTSAQRHDTWDLDLAENLYLVPIDGGDPVQLTENGHNFDRPAVSPDGTQVAFLGYENAELDPQNTRVGVVPVGGGRHRFVSEGLDRSFRPTAGIRAPVWLDDTTIVASAEDRGDTHLYRLAADGSTDPQPITDGRVAVTGFHAAGGRIVTTVATADHPAELHDEHGPLTNLTTSFLGWEKFTVPTTDGTGEIDAWVMCPRDIDRGGSYPLLLNVHGGPFTQYGESFHDEFQMQAAAGFVIVACNPRGGSGRDTAWGQAILGPKHPFVPGAGWGSVDADDVMAVLDATLDRYSFCDRDRVGMLGGSYGGFMATTLATRFSDRFGAICSERAVNNMLSEEWSSDIGSSFRVEIGPRYLDDPDEYTRISPVGKVRDIDVPMMLIHSENDLRCPINQAEELFMALRLLGKDVTFYRFPGEGHELSRSGSPVHRRMRAEIILDFFARHLAAVSRDHAPSSRPG